jgi:SAM-dependent methyltransferase
VIATEPATCPLCPPSTERTRIAEGVDFEYATCPDVFTFVRCEGCGTLLLDPRPTDEALPALYPEEYGPYHFDRLPAFVRWGRDQVQQRKVDVLLRFAPPRACVVDLGCGGGALLRLMRRAGRDGLHLVGWDFPGPHLDRLEAEGFEIIRGPVVHGAVAERSVDLFVLNQVIEHFARPREVLEVLARALKPGGTIILETPDTRGLDARLFHARYWGGYHFPRHLVLFHREGLVELLARVGLDTVEARSLPSPAFWIQSFHHVASERRLLRPLTQLLQLNNPLAVVGATAFDLMRAPFAPTSNLRVVARKPETA